MQDKDVLDHIEGLVNEEHRLMRKSEDGQGSADDHARMRELQVSLDRAWDLLRQRRAMRDRGENPDDAMERSTKTVEGYEQ